MPQFSLDISPLLLGGLTALVLAAGSADALRRFSLVAGVAGLAVALFAWLAAALTPALVVTTALLDGILGAIG